MEQLSFKKAKEILNKCKRADLASLSDMPNSKEWCWVDILTHKVIAQGCYSEYRPGVLVVGFLDSGVTFYGEKAKALLQCGQPWLTDIKESRSIH